MKKARRYESPKRQAQAAATRDAILQAFADQVSEPGQMGPSPSDAARRAGVSLRTVHIHFPNAESQIRGIGEWFDRHFYPTGVVVASGPDDLARYFHDIHRAALQSPLSRVLATSTVKAWQDVRQKRRALRLGAIREAIEAIGAPAKATEDAIAMILSLSGADASWKLHDLYGLPLERIPDVMANTVQLIVDQLRLLAREQKKQRPSPKSRKRERT